MTDKVKTLIRIRPFVVQDSYQGPLESCIKIAENSKIQLSRGRFDTREFTFDYILREQTTQDDIFSMLFYDVIGDITTGVNRCILTYGQTSSGKTYTLFGASDSALVTGDGTYRASASDGLVPKLLYSIYYHLSQTYYEIQVQYIYIYNNAVYDLFSPYQQALRLREVYSGYFDCQAQRLTANSLSSLFQLLTLGAQRRATASTRMNLNSSRSHVLLKLYFKLNQFQSTLTFCDLAGSERVSKTQSSGDRLIEAKMINYSLSALGNVVVALFMKKKHIPFRDSVLTKLLQESLTKNARTLLICCVCQYTVHFDESVSSLQFAERCGAIQTKFVQNRYNQPLYSNINQDQTVFGKFGLHEADGQEIGFVKCSCPCCGCRLTVLDDEFGENEQLLDKKVDEEVRIGVRCMYDEIERLREQIVRYEAVIKETRSAVGVLRANPVVWDEIAGQEGEKAEPVDYNASYIAPEVEIGQKTEPCDVYTKKPHRSGKFFSHAAQNADFLDTRAATNYDEQLQDVTDSVYEIGASYYETRNAYYYNVGIGKEYAQLGYVNNILKTIGKPTNQVIYQSKEQQAYYYRQEEGNKADQEKEYLINRYLGAGPKLIHTYRGNYPKIVIGSQNE